MTAPRWVVALFICTIPSAGLRAAAPVEFAGLRQGFFNRAVSFAPEAATNLGVGGFNSRLSDISPSGIATQIAYFEDMEQRLAQAPPALDPQERIDREAMATIANSRLHALRDLKSWQYDVNAALAPYEAIQSRMAQIEKGPKALEDWEDIAARVEKIPGYLAQAQANLREGVKNGRTPWRTAVEKTGIEDGEGASRFFLAEILTKARDQLDDAAFAKISDRLHAAAQAAGKAHQDHVSFLSSELLPASNGKPAIGAEEYAWRLKNELGVAASPAELHKRGLALAAKITARMEELAKTIDPSKDLAGVMADLKKDHPADDTALFAEYNRQAERARDFVTTQGLFELPPDYRIAVIPTPEGMRSSLATAAYFPAPPLEKGRKGIFLVTPSDGDPKMLAVHNFSKIPTTVVHEAFPGHDMQFYSFQRSPAISPVRYLLDQAGYASSMNLEGYAHYAEELMRLRGFFTPKEELTQLGAQLWRALRIALDTALHMEWMSVSDVALALEQKAFLAKRNAEVEAYRYTRMPTQAITYMLGRLEIERLKDEYKTVMGDAYSEAKFHELFLSFGPVPPAQMREAFLEMALRGKNGRPEAPADSQLEASNLAKNIEGHLKNGRFGRAIFGIDTFYKELPLELHPMIHPIIRTYGPRAISHFKGILEKSRDPHETSLARDALDFWTRMLRQLPGLA